MKLNATTKKKLEDLVNELGYKVRYEKGRFNSGHCIVQDKGVVIINRFFDTEGRARILFDILIGLPEFDEEKLTDSQQKFLNKLSKAKEELV